MKLRYFIAVTYEIYASWVYIFSTKLTFFEHFFQKTIIPYLCLKFILVGKYFF